MVLFWKNLADKLQAELNQFLSAEETQHRLLLHKLQDAQQQIQRQQKEYV
jgi:hypothetical protein